MRFSNLSMMSTTHFRCKSGILAAFLTHPNYQSNKDLIHEAISFVIGRANHSKWAFAFHLHKKEAEEALTKCLPVVIKNQQSTGMWKRKYANIFTYGILRALKHAELLEQDSFRYDLYQGFREKTDLISILVRKNIMNEANVNVENVVAELFSTQKKNGSWFNSLSATCIQLQIMNELDIDAHHESVSLAIDWLFDQFRETYEVKNIDWRFENIFLTENYAAEQNGFQQVAPEHGRNLCVSSFLSGAGSTIKGNPALTTSIALYTLTKLGYGKDNRIVDAYDSLYNIRGFYESNGEIDEYVWCTGIYKPKSVHYDLKRTGISFEEFLQLVEKRRTNQQKNQ